MSKSINQSINATLIRITQIASKTNQNSISDKKAIKSHAEN